MICGQRLGKETARKIGRKLLNTDSKLVTLPCKLCNYPCGYVANNQKLFYDRGCHCSGHHTGWLDERDWSELIGYVQRGHALNEENVARFLAD